MENNTTNQNASGDCGGKDAKAASFLPFSRRREVGCNLRHQLKNRNAGDEAGVTANRIFEL